MAAHPYFHSCYWIYLWAGCHNTAGSLCRKIRILPRAGAVRFVVMEGILDQKLYTREAFASSGVTLGD